MQQAVSRATRQVAVAGLAGRPDRLFAFTTRDRFLCRVFSPAAVGQWALKGGTGMLARVMGARATRDIDLLRTDTTLESAIGELVELAGIDLGDHYRFVYRRHESILQGEQQPYARGARIRFDAFLGTKALQPVNIDVVIAQSATAPFERVQPASRLDLPRLRSYPYRVYAVVDQIADKVCASMQHHGPDQSESTRVRDLVDLVILARTQRIAAPPLIAAIGAELARRAMPRPEAFTVPAAWTSAYPTLARATPACGGVIATDDALRLAGDLLDPALTETARGTWQPHALAWTNEPADEVSE